MELFKALRMHHVLSFLFIFAQAAPFAWFKSPFSSSLVNSYYSFVHPGSPGEVFFLFADLLIMLINYSY